MTTVQVWDFNPSQRCNTLCIMVLWSDGWVISDGWYDE